MNSENKKKSKRRHKKSGKRVHFNNKISTYLVESPCSYWRTFDMDMFYNQKIQFESDCKINQIQKYNKSNVEIPEALLELKMGLKDRGYFNDFEWLELVLNLKFSPDCLLYEKLKKFYWVIDDVEDINKIRKSNLIRKIKLILIFKNQDRKKYDSLVQLQKFIRYFKIKLEKTNILKSVLNKIDDKILIQRNGTLNQINKDYFEKLKNEQIK